MTYRMYGLETEEDCVKAEEIAGRLIERMKTDPIAALLPWGLAAGRLREDARITREMLAQQAALKTAE